MKNEIVILRIAYEQLIEASLWYESQQKGLAGRFLDDFGHLTEHLSQFPDSCQKRKKQYRFAKLRHFPYLIIYVYEPGIVYIHKIIHAARHPRKRYNR